MWIKDLLKTLVYSMAALCRPLVLLKLVKYLANMEVNAPVRSIKRIFDPNNIRRRTSISIRRTITEYVDSEGIIWKLELDDHIDYQLFIEGNFGNICKEIGLGLNLSSPHLFLDVGANFGTESIPLARNLEVIAFEPQSRMVLRLENSAKENNVQFSIFKLALTSPEIVRESHGQIELFRPAGNSGAASTRFGWNPSRSTPKKELVQAITLDEWFHAHPNSINKDKKVFLKIDVEGQELQVLEGAGEFLKIFRPVVLMEFRPKLLGDAWTSRTLKFLNELNDYNFYQILSGGRIMKLNLILDVSFNLVSELIAYPKEMSEELENICSSL